MVNVAATHSPEHFERISEVLRDLFPEVVRINVIPTSEGKVYLSSREKDLKRPVKLGKCPTVFWL